MAGDKEKKHKSAKADKRDDREGSRSREASDGPSSGPNSKFKESPDKKKQEPEPEKKDPKKEQKQQQKKKTKARRLATNSKNKEKIFQQCGLKKLSREDFDALYAAFQVLALENDEGEQQFLKPEDAAVWLRAMGWCWTDTELEAALRRGGSHTSQNRYSCVELMRCADAHVHERFGKGEEQTEDEIQQRKASQMDGVMEVFNVFDTENTGRIMRGDLMKYLVAGAKASSEEFSESFPTERTSSKKGKDKEKPVIEASDLNAMLEQLGYPSTVLTFLVDDLAKRIADQLSDIPTTAMLT